MAEATLIARIKAVGGKAASAAFNSLVGALRLLRDAAKQAATPLRQVGAAGERARKGLAAAATASTRAAVALRKVGKTTAAAALSKVNQAGQRAAKGLGRMADAINQLNTKLRVLGRSVDSTVTKLRGAGTAARGAGAGIRKAGRSALESGGLLGKFRATLLDAFLIKGLIDTFVQGISRATKALFGLFKGAADASIELTGIQIILKASTKTTTEFATASLKASEIARRYGTDLLVTARGLADFLASSKASNIVFEEQVAIFESLVRVGRVFNLSAEKIKLSILAISQIASKGTVQLEELKRQLGDQIPGVVPGLAKALGITVAELFKKTRDGALSATEGLKALRQVFDDLSAEQAVIASQTLAAELGRLSTEAALVKVAFGDATDEGFRAAAEAATQLFKDLQPLATELGRLAELGILPATTGLIEMADNLTAVIALGLSHEDVTTGQADATAYFVEVLRTAGINLAGMRDELEEWGQAARDVQLKTFIEELVLLAAEARNGGQALTAAFEDTDEARKRAFDEINAIRKAVLEGLLSEVEARRLLRSIVESNTQAELVGMEQLRLAEQRRLEGIEEVIKAKQKDAAATKLGVAAEKAAAAERVKVIGEAVAAGKKAGEARAAEAKRTREEITKQEQQLVDEMLSLFEDGVEGWELSNEKRSELQTKLINKLLDEEQKFQEKVAELIEISEEKLKEKGAKRAEIAEELEEKIREASEKTAKKRQELLDKTVEEAIKAAEKQAAAAEKLADKEIKEAERSAKKRKKLLEGLEDAFRQLAETRRKAFEDEDGGEVSGPSIGEGGDVSGGLAEALKRLAELQDKVSLSVEESNELFDLQANIIPKLQRRLAEVGQTARGVGDDLVGLSDNLLEAFRAATLGSSEFREIFKTLPPEIQDSISFLLENLEKIAAAGNLNRDVFDQSFGELNRLLDIAGVSVGGLATDGIPSLAEELQRLRESTQDSGVQKLAEDAEEAGGKVTVLKDEAGNVVAIVNDLAAGAGEAAEKERDLGVAAEEAAGKVEVLVDPLTGAIEITNDLSEAAEGAAEQETALADAAAAVAENVAIPEDAIESIRLLGTTAQEVAPQLEPLLEPLLGLAETMTELSEAVPLLPEPLAAVVASIIELVQSEVLQPLVEAFQEMLDSVEPLVESMPDLAESLETVGSAAEEGNEPISKFAESLEKLGGEELQIRLGTLGEVLIELSEALVEIAAEGQGFDEAETAAEEFADSLSGDDGVFGVAKELAEFISGEFSRALDEHEVDWGEAGDAAELYAAELRDQIDGLLPEWSAAATKMFDAPSARAEEFLGLLGRISAALKGLRDESSEAFEGSKAGSVSEVF